MEGSPVSVEREFIRSTIGEKSRILNANGLLRKGWMPVVGENTAPHLGVGRNIFSSVCRDSSKMHP